MKLGRYILPRQVPTQRCLIRPISRWSDYDAVADYFNANAQDYPRSMFAWPHYDQPHSSKNAKEYAHYFKNLGVRDYYIFKKGGTDIVGSTMLYQDRGGNPRLTYYIKPEKRGNGYAGECHSAWIRSFFKVNKGLKTMWAEIDPANTASRSVLVKTGFRPLTQRDTHSSGVCGRVMAMRLTRSALEGSAAAASVLDID